jgi:hypothetical protein
MHLLALQWLEKQSSQGSVLRPMATPMFTRLLQAQVPAAPLPTHKPVARARPRHAAITSLVGAAASTHKRKKAPVKKQVANPGGDTTSTSEAAVGNPATPSQPSETKPVPSEATAAPVEPPLVDAATQASTAAVLDTWPPDTRLGYRLGGQFRSGELHGDARVQWLRQGSRYESRVDIDITLLASLVMTSQGEITPQGLLPKAYEEQRRSGRRGVLLEDETIALADGRRLPRPVGVQDTASQFVELSHRFMSGQDVLEVGRSVDLWMARPGGVDLWTYDIVDRELLELPRLGPVEAFHLKPRMIANPRGNITAEMWFAPSLQYLPVRIRVNMDESTYVDLMVEKIEQR